MLMVILTFTLGFTLVLLPKQKLMLPPRHLSLSLLDRVHEQCSDFRPFSLGLRTTCAMATMELYGTSGGCQRLSKGLQQLPSQ